MDSNRFPNLSQSFDPFGSLLARTGAASSSYSFADEWTDTTRLQYLRDSYYSPAQGRFLSKDPFAGILGMPGTLHPYIYSLNNPVLYTDPRGENPLLILAALGFAAGAGYNAWQQYHTNAGWCNFDWIEMLNWGVGGAITATSVAFFAAASIGFVGAGLQGVAITLSSLGIAAPTVGSLWGWGTAFSGLGAASFAWLWTGKGLKEGIAGIAHQALQDLTNKANNLLSKDLSLAEEVLSEPEYQAAKKDEQIARIAYGNAIHRIVSTDIRESGFWRSFYKPITVIGASQPDFIGRGLFSGMNFDITTSNLRSINEHLARWYGPGLIITTYVRPSWFTVVP